MRWRDRFFLLIPNGLSASRLLVGLLFPWIPQTWRLPIVLLAALSDLVDGESSRWFDVSTSFGRLLDPIADKIFVLGLVVTLLVEGTLAWWEILLIAPRDLTVLLAGVGVAIRDGWRSCLEMKPRWPGKATTALQFVYVLVILVNLPVVRAIVLGLTALTSLVAAVDYVVAYRRPGHSQPRESPGTPN